jgi:hypothetical protein
VGKPHPAGGPENFPRLFVFSKKQLAFFMFL